MSLAVADAAGGDMTPVNDCYGSQTVAFGTAMLYLLPPAGDNVRTCAGGFGYLAGGTAHTLTYMVTMFTTKCVSEAASGQATVKLAKNPTAFDGTLIAANDYISFQYEDGTYGYGLVSSLSGTTVTLTANLSKKILKDAPVYFHGAAADHTDRAFTLPASTVYIPPAGDMRDRFATGYDKGTPILAYVNNITATGIWLFQKVYYD